MKIYKTQAEVEADIVDGVLEIDGSVEFACSIDIRADIKAWDITALDITARNITARNITARDITAGGIKAWDITAGGIKAWDIKAWDITAWGITAWNITFFAVCYAYSSFRCRSCVGRRHNSKFFCLDSNVVFMEAK